MQEAARERLDLEYQPREAMRSGQLSMHYQLKYSIATRKMVGAEHCFVGVIHNAG